jgi:hypothetical protein
LILAWAPSVSPENGEGGTIALEYGESGMQRQGRSGAPPPESLVSTPTPRQNTRLGTANPASGQPLRRCSVTAPRTNDDARDPSTRPRRHTLGLPTDGDGCVRFSGEQAEPAAAQASGVGGAAAFPAAPGAYSRALDYSGRASFTGLLPGESQYSLLDPSQIVTPSAFLPLSYDGVDARSPHEARTSQPSAPALMTGSDHLFPGAYGQFGPEPASPAEAPAVGQLVE